MNSHKNKHPIIKGTFVLSVTGIAAKGLGFYYKIFLTSLIGVNQLGIYQMIFPMFTLAITLCVSGLSTTIIKYIPRISGKYDISKTLFECIWFSLNVCFILSIILVLSSKCIGGILLSNTECEIYIAVITAALPFIAVKSCLNAYFLGKGNANYFGASHLIEQLARIMFLFVCSKLTGIVTKDARLGVYSAIMGEIISMIYIIFAFKKYKNKENMKANRTVKPASFSAKIISESIPLTINNAFINLVISVEAILLPCALKLYYSNYESALIEFGIISGIVIPFLIFPSTITSALSTVILPSVSEAVSQKKERVIIKALSKGLFFCTIYGIIIALIYHKYGIEICKITFNNTEAGKILVIMSFLCPLIYVSNILTYILNGIASPKYVLWISIVALYTRISFCLFAVPNLGINYYIIGLYVSYTIMDILLLLAIINKIGRITNLNHKELPDIHNN